MSSTTPYQDYAPSGQSDQHSNKTNSDKDDSVAVNVVIGIVIGVSFFVFIVGFLLGILVKSKAWLCRGTSLKNEKDTENVVEYTKANIPQDAINALGEAGNTGPYADLNNENRSRDYANVGAYESIEKVGVNSGRDYVNVNDGNGQRIANTEYEDVSGVHLNIALT